MSAAIDVDDDNFGALVEEDGRLFLLDFHAPWCEPCKALAPTLEETVASYGGELGFAKIDVDVAKSLARRFGIKSVPTLVLYRHRNEIGRIDARTRTRITAAIDRHLARGEPELPPPRSGESEEASR